MIGWSCHALLVVGGGGGWETSRESKGTRVWLSEVSVFVAVDGEGVNVVGWGSRERLLLSLV
jgi:hypothetical protein